MEPKIAGRTLAEWKEHARRDDALEHMVPSDLRAILGQIAIKKEDVSSAMDRHELAVMAYMRLGKLTKDDEKTRQMRLGTLREYVASRIALSRAMQRPIDAEELVLEERKRCAKIAKYHTHHALWAGLPNAYNDLSEGFGIALAQRIESSILEEPIRKEGT